MFIQTGCGALYLSARRDIVRDDSGSIEASFIAVQQQESECETDGQLFTTPTSGHVVTLANEANDDARSEHIVSSGHHDEIPSVSVEDQELFLTKIFDELSGCFPDLVFTVSQVHDADKLVPVLLITQRRLFKHPPFGAVSRVQIAVHYKSYTVHVLMKEWKRSSFETVAEIRELCQIIEDKSNFKFCPGIEPDHYNKEYYDVIRFHVQSVRLHDFPFHRVDSVNCKMLFKLAHNDREMEKDAIEVKCSACKRLITDLEHQKERTKKETPTRKIKRQKPSSRARLSYMSPASQAKRRTLAQYERTNNIQKLQKYEESEVTLDDEQHSEMCQIMENIGTHDLEMLYKEGDEHGVRKVMQDIWITDKERQRNEFASDQATNSTLYNET